jgi:hypothetical protein
MAGYSNKALCARLGIKPGDAIVAINVAEDYAKLVAPLPAEHHEQVAQGRCTLSSPACLRGRWIAPLRARHLQRGFRLRASA